MAKTTRRPVPPTRAARQQPRMRLLEFVVQPVFVEDDGETLVKRFANPLTFGKPADLAEWAATVGVELATAPLAALTQPNANANGGG